MKDANVADFGEFARPGNRVVFSALPGDAAQDAFKFQEFKKSRGRQGADNVATAAHADHQGARGARAYLRVRSAPQSNLRGDTATTEFYRDFYSR